MFDSLASSPPEPGRPQPGLGQGEQACRRHAFGQQELQTAPDGGGGGHGDLLRHDDLEQRQMEYEHHGDRLVPRQQRFSEYTRGLMRALDVPVHNTWGLRPAVVAGTKDIAPLTVSADLDDIGLLTDVPTLSFHQHLPHYELTAPAGDGLRVLGRQLVDPDRPHPFTAAGNTEFNAVIWMPPAGDRAGDVVLIDSTHFTTLFGGTESLRRLWSNLVTMRQV